MVLECCMAVGGAGGRVSLGGGRCSRATFVFRRWREVQPGGGSWSSPGDICLWAEGGAGDICLWAEGGAVSYGARRATFVFGRREVQRWSVVWRLVAPVVEELFG